MDPGKCGSQLNRDSYAFKPSYYILTLRLSSQEVTFATNVQLVENHLAVATPLVGIDKRWRAVLPDADNGKRIPNILLVRCSATVLRL